jgi:membrane-bound serine protease (ClpP class)
MDALAHLVMNPWVTIFLLVAGCALLFHDLLTPFTWGWTGTLGVICLGTFFAASIFLHNASWVGVLLMTGGIGLLLLETHLWPGRGLPAFVGLGLLFAGMYQSLGGGGNMAYALPVSLTLTTITLVGFFAYLPKSPVWKQLSRELRTRQHAPPLANSTHFLGKHGTTQTSLRPYGVVEIDGYSVSVLTEGDFLEPGTHVSVTQVVGDRIVVETVGHTA